MIRKMLRRWLGVTSTVRGENPEEADDTRRFNPVLDHDTGGPAFMVYRVANGFIVRTGVGAKNYTTIGSPTARSPVLTYCKNPKEVADLILADTARSSLGVNQQYEMFDTDGSVVVGRSSSTSVSGNTLTSAAPKF